MMSIENAVGQYGEGKVSGQTIDIVCVEGYSLPEHTTNLFELICHDDGDWDTYPQSCYGKKNSHNHTTLNQGTGYTIP